MNRLERLCLEHGLRMNPTRRAIIEVLAKAEDHPSADDVYRRATALDCRISIATVYRTLNILADAGLLTRLELGDEKLRYEEACDKRHEHLVDARDGIVVEFCEPHIEQLIRHAAAKLGYEVIDYHLEIVGVTRAPKVAAAADGSGVVRPGIRGRDWRSCR